MTESSKLYDRLWLWFELGELCKTLRWPAGGGFVLYAIWTFATWPAGMAVKLVTAAAACAAVQIVLMAGIKLSGIMVQTTIHKLNRILFWPYGIEHERNDAK